MAKIIEKILLGIIFIVLVGFNSVFILGQQNAVYTEKLESSEEISEEQAKLIALNIASGVVEEIEEKTINGITFYEIEIEDDFFETELKINKKNGSIFQITQEEKDEDISEDLENNDSQIDEATLTEEQIINIALKLIGGKFVNLEIERENGKLIYEVKIEANGDTAEVEVDAKTGEVLEIEWGDD